MTKAMTKLSKEGLSNLPEAGKKLRTELKERGYSVLESNEILSCINNSIIVGGEYGKDHKGDFYEIADSLGLKYKSGQYYTQRE